MPRQFLNATPISFFFFYFLIFSLKTPVFAANTEAIVLFSWLNSSSFSNWDPQDSDPCGWSHIICSSQNLVSEINIQSVQLALPLHPTLFTSLKSLQKLTISAANLTGTIPAEIGDCFSLKKIDFSYNSLAGDIPASIGKLETLEELTLNSNQLTGKIPGEIGSCTGLKSISLFDNKLSGSIPVEIGNISGLESLRAGGNQDIDGEIPDEISKCSNLEILGLADTKISGKLPPSIGNLKKLQVLSLYTTMLSGEIPGEIGNCTELVDLYLYENSLSGFIPGELGKLQKLEKLLLWQNNLVGPIPEEIGNCNNLVIFDVSLNFLSGSLPESFGNLTNLEELMLSSNNISGSIPAVLSNAASLVQFQIDGNQITGSIPGELGFLSRLQIFFAWDNKLEGNIPTTLSGCESLQALDLSRNTLTGFLPSSIFQLRNLTKLLLIYNSISGSIPPEIGNCTSLIRLRLVGNKINGQIPREIGFLENLNFLDISNNRLIGSVPDEIGNCRELQMLNLAGNLISGYLPGSISSLSKLEVLDLTMNRLDGQIPGSYGELFSLNRLLLGNNMLSGLIPSTLGRCSRLQLLDLSRNQLFGSIPVEIFKIEALEIALNLSWNGLTGQIPSQIVALNKLSVLDLSHNNLDGDLMPLSGLVNLVSLNVSYNNFTGYLPDNKLFRQLSSTELAGNDGLCAGKGRDSCFLREIGISRDGRKWRLRLAIAILALVTISLAVVGVLAVLRVRKTNNGQIDSEFGESDHDSSSSNWKLTPFQKLNFSVSQILKCLVEANVIGKGCSGIVYRAQLENGEFVAVKKLWPTTVKNDHGVRDSFSTEVRTLGSIRHKNIVKFLGCCWNRNTRLLMYEYMPNGSLGSILHEKNGPGCLDWDVRYRIILGAAQGLAYLHHDCVPPIVHRDIKANNILIGLDFEAYIADFGLAKLVDDGDFARSSNTVAGSYGYIAPEYGYMMKITEKSDVYSYGVVVLEVLTGKQPIDPTIPDGLHIVDWVRQKRGGPEVLDPSLRSRPDPETGEMMQTLGVAMLCVNPSPDDRPNMKDIAAMLKEIRHERGENSKDVVIKGSSQVADEQGNNIKSCSNGGPSSRMQSLYLQSNNSSFSASSLLNSTSSIGKFGFNKK
ncbi:LRR receptor-like serine/threonine-protein kinase rch1 [Phtheirospermum japonicum]|uniref:LRR receptor-like serine/threonine-protein kinase rch1 n=1 Tax=Phtheirospermum japonicum TaxID=374723 RepID=A0A830BWD2_9LAMI|nr:LRR receptor-like serine/threonine-protein kinase rch1 [Phtheirospermum japonicum]